MAARPAPAPAAGVDYHPEPETEAARPYPIPSEGTIEVLGRAVDGELARHLQSTGDREPTGDETMRALRLLALDNLIDLVQLRETLAATEARAALLETQLMSWRDRALAEAAGRTADASEAFQRQRELVTVLHRQLIENDELQAELAWRRRPWWRRLRRRPATASPTLASAAR